jgi:pimeloyl-ACP methyl ester carboxylesterase
LTASSRKWLAALPVALVGLAAAYAIAAACLLRFNLDRLLFPPVPLPPASRAPAEAFRVAGHDGAAMVVRRLDRTASSARQGCVVFFPGHDGGFDRYARELFPDLERAGLAVYAVAYPGQDGAPGPARIADVRSLAAAVVARVVASCGPTRTVVAGRSLGAMIAAYACADASPAGLVLESTAATLSGAIRGGLREHWFLRPLVLLPMRRILAHDFSLAEALPSRLHVAIFQGSADTRTPLEDLSVDAVHAPIVVVDGGTHTDTLQRAKPAMIATMLGMIRGSQEAAAAGGADD